MSKFESQSCHFNKKSYSLHCTVLHKNPNIPIQYIYHLSNEMKHNSAFTATVINHLVEITNPSIIRFKSDNCATLYKCKWIFNYYSYLAIRLQKTVLTYYGASGHGKGLVDAMSGFGVKGPIHKAVITENFHYDSAEDIHAYLVDLFHGDSNKSFPSPCRINCTESPKISFKDQELHAVSYDSVFSRWIYSKQG